MRHILAGVGGGYYISAGFIFELLKRSFYIYLYTWASPCARECAVWPWPFACVRVRVRVRVIIITIMVSQRAVVLCARGAEMVHNDVP